MKLQLLLNVINYLKGYNITPFLCEGTLLGCIRDNNFIDWDPDIDIGILYKDDTTTLKVFHLIKQKFSIKKTYGFLNDGYEITINTDPRIDIFFYYPKLNQIYNSCYSFRYPNFIKINYFYDQFDLTKTTFLNNEFFIPDDPIKYLCSRYGSDWRIPINKEYTLYDPSNCVLDKTYTYKEIINNYD
jgi:hypothetical protein